MSSFEKLRPAPAVSPPGAEAFGPLGRVPLGSPVAGASVFRDFDGGADGLERESPSVAPAATPEPERDAVQQAADAAYADGIAAGRTTALRELVGQGEAFAQALAELKRFRAGLMERY